MNVPKALLLAEALDDLDRELKEARDEVMKVALARVRAWESFGEQWDASTKRLVELARAYEISEGK